MSSNYSYKIKTESKLCENVQLFGAFPAGDCLTFTLVISRRMAASRVSMRIYDDNTCSERELSFEFVELKSGEDVYKLSLKLEECGLYFYDIYFEGSDARVYVKRDEQLTVYEADFSTPDWIKGGMIYQIFVDRFSKGGEVKLRDDAVLKQDWYNDEPEYSKTKGGRIPNNSFFGGTLYGVVDKLDHISSLGADCIYLNPIFEAYSNHKYDTADFEKIDDMFGGEQAFELLIREADKRGIRIILDGVFNHTGDNSRYFNRYKKYGDGGAYNDPDSRYCQWYSFKSYPNEYESWWNIDILPRVKSDNPDYKNYILGENGIVRRYLKKGISGWRIDVADELSDSFLHELRSAARSEKKDSLIIGEVWEDASNKISYGKRKSYFQGNELDSVMNYVMRDAIIDFVKNRNANEFATRAEALYKNYPKCVSDVLMNILGTHDTGRILTELGAQYPDEMTNEEACAFRLSDKQRALAKERLKAAWLICSTVPGVPSIYYGDEAGMEGWSDPFCRRTYPWGREDKELLDFYTEVGNFRRNNPIYREGFFKIDYAKDGLLVFSRFDKHQVLYTLSNMSDTELLLPKVMLDAIHSRPIKSIPSGRTVVLKK